MENNLSNELLASYLAGQCTDAESAEVERWIISSRENSAEFEEARRAWIVAEPAAVVGNTEQFVAGMMQGVQGRGKAVGRGRFSVGSLRQWIGYTTIVAAIGIAGFIPTLMRTSKSIPQSRTYSTTIGQRANITLFDGSSVILAPATTMKVSGRQVYLTGEAVFTVIQRNNYPFTVQAGNTTARVLGTTFAVRAYNNQVRVAVIDGKVSVGSNILSASDVLTVKGGQATLRRGVDLTSAFTWTTGKLVFQNAPVREVFAELNRWYDVELVLLDSAQQNHLITTMISDPAMNDNVVATLALALNSRAVRRGRTITFTPISEQR